MKMLSALRHRFILFFVVIATFNSCAALEDLNLNRSLSSDEIVRGLRQALEVGSNLASGRASTIDGFLGNELIRIPFPEEARRVENTLRDLGLGSLTDDFIKSLNRAAEMAAKDAAPIFVNAIREMTIQDGISILRGEQDAATQYMRNATATQLRDIFKPTVQKALDATLATKYWTDITTQYNRIPLVQRINPDLSDYATSKAIDGLFTLVAEEEARIRKDPAARTTDLLKRVFGANATTSTFGG